MVVLIYSMRREKVHKICDQIREKMRIAFNENHCRVNFVVRKHAALLLRTVICGYLHFNEVSGLFAIIRKMASTGEKVFDSD